MRRVLLLVPVMALTLALPAGDAAAQDAITVARQTEDYAFGQVIRFNLEAQATTLFTQANLTIEIANGERIHENPTLPRSSRLSLSHELDVASHSIPPFAEITYQWELTTLGGASQTTAPRTFRYEDNRAGWTWHTERAGNILVHWDGEEPGVPQLALDVAQESLGRTNDLLGTSSTQDIHIYIYPNLDELNSGLRLHALSLQDWVAAMALPEHSVIVLSASPGPTLYVDLNRDLPHELTHVVIYRAAPDHAAGIPAWYNEGLAILSSAEPDPALRVTLEGALHDGSLLPLASLCGQSFAGLPPAEAALAYAQSESLVRYVKERFGPAGIRNLLAAFADGASCEAGVAQALGLSLNSLELEWQADLRRDTPAQSASSARLLPWLLLIGLSLLLSLLFILPTSSRYDSHRS